MYPYNMQPVSFLTMDPYAPILILHQRSEKGGGWLVGKKWPTAARQPAVSRTGKGKNICGGSGIRNAGESI